MHARSERRVTAVLGPTNTGKTYLAMERMLGHRTGMIGFPLRLLARENYDRARRLKGAGAVALVTGEERILPAHPAYFVCTVESMPLDRRVGFLAVDEIQMAADPERGHLFTHRLLHARGEDETMFLGADTVRPLLRKLVPEAEVIGRPRFSTLNYAGPKKLTRLPPRSAAVAFSAADVYAIAELIRRQRGGTAVVMGALSPRTRNAQVAMYQAGEVDYLVATDAIGMGLNMDLEHVAFAALRKYDGRVPRRLTAAELAQIAGRAGRHMNDGSFGTTAEVGPLEPEIVEAIENHRFDPLAALFWRNHDLDFRSPAHLARSLGRRPERDGLTRAREAEDQQALAALIRDDEAMRLAQGRGRVELLWEVCQIPDFRKMLTDAHARLLGQIFRHLAADGRLPEDWVARQVASLDRTEGDIDTLIGRIAHVRTWTYISYRPDWLADAAHWQERTRAIEDRLSDALHERLTQRFVDRRQAVLVRRMKGGGRLLGAVAEDGEVTVEGQPVGRLEGFRFVPDRAAGQAERRSLVASARRALLGREIPARLKRCEEAEDDAFALTAAGYIAWKGASVGRLSGGASPLAPRVEAYASDLLEGPARERLRRRLAQWFDRLLRRRLAVLCQAREAPLAGAARGLVFQLVERLGAIPRGDGAAQVDALGPRDRRALARLGLRLGTESIWIAGPGQPGAAALAALLWSIHRQQPLPVLPAGRPASFAAEDVPAELCLALGYRRMGRLAVRLDALERLAKAARQLARQGPFAATEALRATIGCALPELGDVLAALGYGGSSEAGIVSFAPARPGRVRRQAPRFGKERPSRAGGAPPDSPFAMLSELRFRK